MFRVHEEFPEHQKLEAIYANSPVDWAMAMGVWLAICCDCTRRLSDGVFPDNRINKVLGSDSRVLAMLLVLEEAGLLQSVQGGRLVHDWFDYQPSRDHILGRRASDTVRKRGLRGARRFAILKRDGFRCRYCGATPEDGVKLHVDHIKPVSSGGTNSPSNLGTACEQCNLGKSDTPLDEANGDGC